MSSQADPQSAPEPSAPPAQPSWLSRVHAWGVQNPKYYYIAPPSVWAVFLYIVCLIPLQSVEPVIDAVSFPLADKVFHLCAFAILALLIIRGWHREKMPPIDLHGFVWLLCIVFGIMIEMQQGLTPYRSFEVLDIVADGLGAFLGLALWQILMWRWGRRTRLYPGLFRGDAGRGPTRGRKTTDTP